MKRARGHRDRSGEARGQRREARERDPGADAAAETDSTRCVITRCVVAWPAWRPRRRTRGTARGRTTRPVDPHEPGIRLQARLCAAAGHRGVRGRALGPGTLYGAIGRLEERGLIEAAGEAGRRRPYRLSAAGAQALEDALADLRVIVDEGPARLARRRPARGVVAAGARHERGADDRAAAAPLSAAVARALRRGARSADRGVQRRRPGAVGDAARRRSAAGARERLRAAGLSGGAAPASRSAAARCWSSARGRSSWSAGSGCRSSPSTGRTSPRRAAGESRPARSRRSSRRRSGSALVLAGIACAGPSLAALLRDGGWAALRRRVIPAALLTVAAIAATVGWRSGRAASRRASATATTSRTRSPSWPGRCWASRA